jgi:nucleoside-triphosphatase THEP1
VQRRGDGLGAGTGKIGDVTRSAGSVRTWQRAAVLGSLWAAVEIVVGSFLHNLRVPFAGSLLAAFGIVVMTAGHRAMPDRGIIWRAALICALMKSVSPSAVILGPMVGILSEGLLLQAAVALLGANAAGYLVGGALAGAWPLAQKLASTVIVFGPDVVRLYVEAYRYAARSLGVSGFGPFDLVAALLVLECATGVGAAVVGMRLGRRAGTVTDEVALQLKPPPADPTARPAPGPWSIPRLVVSCAVLVGGMAGIASVPLAAAAVVVGAFAAWVFRAYPRAMARLRRPAFWAELGGVMLLAGLLLGGLQGGAAGLFDGLRAGTEMVLRAVLALVGFTAISVELRNPRILDWLERRRMQELSGALGVAFGALPAFTAALSNQRAFWRRPMAVLAGMLQLANNLSVARGEGHPRLVILTGRTGAGKTTLAGDVVERLRKRGVGVAGLLARGLVADSRRAGFDLIDLGTGREMPLCRVGEPGGPDHERCGPFEFTREGLAFGRAALAGDAMDADLVVVDEVGPLELSGGGWCGSLDRLAVHARGALLVVARLAVVDAVKTRWGTAETPVWDVAHADADALADLIAGLAASPAGRRPAPLPRGAIAREKKTVSAMVGIYCADHHRPAGGLCKDCEALLAYSHARLDRCPYGDDKPACKECPVHCYQPAKREAMRAVMRHAGPKMLSRHPWLALTHLWKERVRGTPPRPGRSRSSAAPARSENPGSPPARGLG